MRWDEQRVEKDLRLPGRRRRHRGPHLRCPRGDGDQLPRGPGRRRSTTCPDGRYGFNWTINPYRGCTHACVFCFARRTHTYLDFDAGRDFEREIVVKVNVPELLRAELARPSWKRELVALGTNTDPYQWVESRYRMMPEILAALEEAETPVSVLTKSPLVMRDVEIYERMAAEGLPVSVNLSVPTLDEKAWRATEPHTPSPAARLDAVAELRRRGIDSGVLIAPLMPGINDTPEQVQPIVDRAREAGANFLGGVALHLRGEVRDVFFGWLKEKRPDLLPRYEQLYDSGRAYMRPDRPQPASAEAVRRLGPGAAAQPAQSRRQPKLRRTLASLTNARCRATPAPTGGSQSRLTCGGSGGEVPTALPHSTFIQISRTGTPCGSLSSRNRRNRAPCRIRPAAAWS